MANFSPPFQAATMRAVAFDLDDTLFDRHAALCRLFEAWLGKENAASAWPEILTVDDGGRSSRRKFFWWLKRRFPALPEDLSRRFRMELCQHISPDPAAVELLSHLSASGLPVALLSNGNAAFQMAKLRAAGVASFFRKSHLLFSDTLGYAKPDARAFLALAERLQISPERILFVGDDLQRDVAGARAAGLKACLLQRRIEEPGEEFAVANLSTLIRFFPVAV